MTEPDFKSLSPEKQWNMLKEKLPPNVVRDIANIRWMKKK